MYQIIEFDEEEKSTEIVPTSWCFSKDDVTFAFWPPWEDKGKIIKAIALRCPYNPQWENYKIARVFAEASTYKMALEKLEIANYTSGVEEEFEKRSNKRLRSSRHKKRILSTSGDSDDNESSTLKQKKLADFPDPPSTKVHEDNSPMTPSAKIIKKESIMGSPNKDNLPNKTAKKEKIAENQVTISSMSQSIPQALLDNKDFSGNIKSSLVPNEFMDEDKIDEYRRTDSTLLPSPQVLVENNNSSKTTKSSSTPNKFQYTEKIAKYSKKSSLSLNSESFIKDDKNSNGTIDFDNEVFEGSQRADEGNVQLKKTSSYVLTKDGLLALNDDNRFLHISGMMQRIIKGQAELKVLIQTNKSGGNKNFNDGNDYAEIMITGKLFPFNEYETFKRFNEDRLAKDKKLVEKVTKYLNTLGGKDDDGDSFVRACLKTILTDQLANQFNLMGRNNKKSFKQLTIYTIIVEAAFVSCNGFKEKNTYESTGLWLKQSKKRIQDKEEREARAANKQ